MVRNLAIIPARSGSKRIPDKNIHPFAGKPLLAWSVGHALESGVFDRVYVSTDSERYAEIARAHGAWVPFLRDAGADDFATVAQVVVRETERIEEFTGTKYDNVAVIQPTCPLCDGGTIRGAYEEFLRRGEEMMTACFPFSYGNPWWAMKLSEDGRGTFAFEAPDKSRSQDRPQLYCPTGAIAFVRVEAFRRNPSPYAPGRGFYPIPWRKGFDIDEPEDLEMGELLFRMEGASDGR